MNANDFNLVAIATGAAARILVRFDYSQEQAAELMRRAWRIVQENQPMKFRKKPIIVEAEQFRHPATSPCGVHTEEDGRAYVITAHEQKVYLEPGDWIVPEPTGNGRYYPIKPEIFEATFERME